MKHLHHLLALSFMHAALLSAVPVAAQPADVQPGGPCAMASDTVVMQALGPAARGYQGARMAGFDLCGVRTPAQDPIAILRLSGQFEPGDRSSGRPVDPDAALTPDHAVGVVVDATPIDGIGDSASFRHLQVDGGTLASLRVEHGSEAFLFNVKDGADAQPVLLGLAQAVMANLAP